MLLEPAEELFEIPTTEGLDQLNVVKIGLIVEVGV
jgi:hypothetical protein